MKPEFDSSMENKGIKADTVDLVMFMGQSNMAGRGTASEAPVVPKGYGYEFRAISDPTKLYDIVEPFGVNENNANGNHQISVVHENSPGLNTIFFSNLQGY